MDSKSHVMSLSSFRAKLTPTKLEWLLSVGEKVLPACCGLSGGFVLILFLYQLKVRRDTLREDLCSPLARAKEQYINRLTGAMFLLPKWESKDEAILIVGMGWQYLSLLRGGSVFKG